MGYEIILYFIMLAVFFGYVGVIWAKYGILPSISESFYRLPVKWRPMFTFFCWGFAFPAVIIGLNLANGSPWEFLMFLASAGIVFVGAAAAFKQELTNTVHFVAAGLGVLCSQLALILIYNLWPLSVAFLLFSVITLFLKRNVLWWIELAAFLTISIAFGILLL